METYETNHFLPLERPDGLVEYTVMYDSPNKLCVISRKEKFSRRCDGLKLIYRTTSGMAIGFAHFMSPDRLSSFIERPFVSECYWKFRLDGVVSSHMIDDQRITIKYQGRPDRKITCEGTLRRGVPGGPEVSLVIGFEGEGSPLELASVCLAGSSLALDADRHVREFKAILETRM